MLILRMLEYIIQSSKYLSVEYCFLFFYSGFVFILSSEKAKIKKRQHNKQWYSEGVAVYHVVTGHARR
jgi:hypothetical protein